MTRVSVLEYNPSTPRRYAPTVQFDVESLSSLPWNECPVCVEYTVLGNWRPKREPEVESDVQTVPQERGVFYVRLAQASSRASHALETKPARLVFFRRREQLLVAQPAYVLRQSQAWRLLNKNGMWSNSSPPRDLGRKVGLTQHIYLGGPKCGRPVLMRIVSDNCYAASMHTRLHRPSRMALSAPTTPPETAASDPSTSSPQAACPPALLPRCPAPATLA